MESLEKVVLPKAVAEVVKEYKERCVFGREVMELIMCRHSFAFRKWLDEKGNLTKLAIAIEYDFGIEP